MTSHILFHMLFNPIFLTLMLSVIRLFAYKLDVVIFFTKTLLGAWRHLWTNLSVIILKAIQGFSHQIVTLMMSIHLRQTYKLSFKLMFLESTFFSVIIFKFSKQNKNRFLNAVVTLSWEQMWRIFKIGLNAKKKKFEFEN